MSIYTKTGDKGTTALVGGTRVKKTDLRVETYGTVDELNALLSLAAKAVKDDANQTLLEALQFQLFYLGAELATADASDQKADQRRIGVEDIEAMELAIDRCMAALPPVHSFVLPGTTEVGSRLHVARTIARRAERRAVELAEQHNIRPELLKYLNRLSDCLYALARFEDQLAQTQQIVDAVVQRYVSATQTGSAMTDVPSPACQPLAHKTLTHKPLALDFSLTHRLLQQAMQAATAINVPVVIALADRNGNTILTYRMPTALLVSLELAPKKAYTAVALKTATHELSAVIQPGADLFQLEASTGGKVVTFGGGYPLYRDGHLVGGLGISGGTVEQDMTIAQAAIHGLHLGKEE